MKRFLLAIALALILHGLLFSIEFDWMGKSNIRIKESEVISISLNYLQPERPVITPEKKSYDEILPLAEPTRVSPEKKIEEEKPVIKPKSKKPIPLKEPDQIPEIKEVIKPEIPQEILHDKILESPSNNIIDSNQAQSLDEELPGEKITEIINNTGGMDEIISLPPAIKETPPTYMENPVPEYPERARRRRLEGTVLLDVFVDMDGIVRDLRVEKSSGYAILDNAAREAVEKWIFVPGTRGDKSIAMWVKVPIRFQLK